jgi:hypothetical protein
MGAYAGVGKHAGLAPVLPSLGVQLRKLFEDGEGVVWCRRDGESE